mgnify:FL=1
MKLELPDLWMKHFFLAHTYLDLQLSDQSAEIYSSLLETGFQNSSYVTAQLAVAYDNMKSRFNDLSFFFIMFDIHVEELWRCVWYTYIDVVS